ncbi:Uncharacterized protein APZ42_021368 [Daphnia magna]|uniref:Uncharacterized protein n=1 Tax=Daphnia magna TaxID=35525 RepID=A0A164WQX6_9CRUS|nr:Uncharacterized protein APZ42_021368 [Daphnia magna]
MSENSVIQPSDRRGHKSKTGILGLDVIQQSANHIVRRLVWLTALTTCLVLAVVHGASLIQRYRSYPTRVQLDVSNRQGIALPAVTVCPLDRFDVNRLERLWRHTIGGPAQAPDATDQYYQLADLLPVQELWHKIAYSDAQTLFSLLCGGTVENRIRLNFISSLLYLSLTVGRFVSLPLTSPQMLAFFYISGRPSATSAAEETVKARALSKLSGLHPERASLIQVKFIFKKHRERSTLSGHFNGIYARLRIGHQLNEYTKSSGWKVTVHQVGVSAWLTSSRQYAEMTTRYKPFTNGTGGGTVKSQHMNIRLTPKEFNSIDHPRQPCSSEPWSRADCEIECFQRIVTSITNCRFIFYLFTFLVVFF